MAPTSNVAKQLSFAWSKSVANSFLGCIWTICRLSPLDASSALSQKKLGLAKLFIDSDTLVGTLDYGTLRVATATMGYKHKPLDLDKAREEVGVPTFMLKMLPGYTGRPRICELVRTQITNVTVMRPS